MKVKCCDCGSIFRDEYAVTGYGGEPDEEIMLCPACLSSDLERIECDEDDETYVPRIDYDVRFYPA